MAYSIKWWENRIPPPVRRQVRLWIAPVKRNLPGRRPRWGNLRRAKPFSDCYGWDRGQPVDRMYIERFLERMSHRIRGDVLEVRSSDYTRRFGAADHRSHVLDIDASNRAATIIGDLCDPRTLAPASYDCVILTQTLQFLSAPDAAIASLYDSLRSGGTMLITVPCAARIDPEAPESDYRRWTPAGLRQMVGRQCERAAIEVEGGGNLIAALVAMLGCAVQDLRRQDLAVDDPVFPIIACAAVTKRSSS
jgi:SAM-dependent methyltransferase